MKTREVLSAAGAFACMIACAALVCLYLRSVWEDLAVMKTILPEVIVTSSEEEANSGGIHEGNPVEDKASAEGEETKAWEEADALELVQSEDPGDDPETAAGSPSAAIRTVNSNNTVPLPAYSCVGTIAVLGTKIAYPLMQSEDETFFLTHDSGGKRNRNGAIFLDPQNAADLSDPVNYVFGHNMKSGLMFGTLKKFLAPDYLETHDLCTVTVGGTAKSYRLVAAAKADAGTTLTRFNGECLGTAEYASFVEKVSEMLGAGIPSNAELIFLITCSNKKTERIVVCGVLEK